MGEDGLNDPLRQLSRALILLLHNPDPRARLDV
jgi:hypothetical protein